MSKWVTGSELIKDLKIEPFELFGLFREGLRPYINGKPVYDADLSDRSKSRDSILYRSKLLAYFYNIKSDDKDKEIEKKLIDVRAPEYNKSLIRDAIRTYGMQDIMAFKPPDDAIYKNFSLPQDQKQATDAINEALSFVFLKSEVKIFTIANGYPWPIHDPAGVKEVEELPAGMRTMLPFGGMGVAGCLDALAFSISGAADQTTVDSVRAAPITRPANITRPFIRCIFNPILLFGTTDISSIRAV
ncbi:MAG: hypothetical protein HQK58_12155 [Deltaproteobacteria bacterium]|nr:hypothetical protein [Deltaproteobacteria bacterium]